MTDRVLKKFGAVFSWAALFFVWFSCGCLFSSELKVYYVSVGQGDSEYIELPNGENVLIDGGPNSSDSTLNPIIKFLEAKGVKEIKYVFLSHSHSDHYSGLIPIFSRYTIGTYYDSFIPGSSTVESFRTLAKSKAKSYVDTTTMNLQTSATFYSISTSTPPLYIVMHHRGDAYAGSIKSANDTSLIFKIIFGSSTFIFGGDAGYGGSYQPLELAVSGLSNPPNPSGIKTITSPVDCYKVHHHGSSTSSSDGFLSVIKPKYAFIGVGLGNSFGHPTQEALTRITNAISAYHPEVIASGEGGHYGAGIFATDYDGTIEVVTSGDGNYKITKNYVPTASGGTSGGTTPGGTTTTSSAGDFVSFVNALNNLFNPAKGEWLRIEYYLNNPGESVFRVYTISGEVVYEEKKRDDYAGDLKAWVWNGRNSDGKIVAPGAYFIFVKTPDTTVVKQAVVIR